MNKTSNYELTIIVPIFNEEDNMQKLEELLSLYLPKALRTTCVLFVNDCSTDSSLAKVAYGVQISIGINAHRCHQLCCRQCR